MGVNEYVSDSDVSPKLLRVDPAREREQVERLHAVCSRRDALRTADALTAVRTTGT